MQGQEPNQHLSSSNEELNIVPLDQKADNSELGPPAPKSSKRKRGKESSQVHSVDESATFNICSIQLGSWKREIIHYEGDMKLKCYFKKKTFLWEVLDGQIQRKVVYNWNDLALVSFKQDPNKGELQLMVKNSPSFFLGNALEPHKHTVWVSSKDFTENNAASNRLHILRFRLEVYTKLYKRIMAVVEIYPDLNHLILSGVTLQTSLPMRQNQIPIHETCNKRPNVQFHIQSHHHLPLPQSLQHNNTVPSQTPAIGFIPPQQIMSQEKINQEGDTPNVQPAWNPRHYQVPSLINTNSEDYGNAMINHEQELPSQQLESISTMINDSGDDNIFQPLEYLCDDILTI